MDNFVFKSTMYRYFNLSQYLYLTCIMSNTLRYFTDIYQ